MLSLIYVEGERRLKIPLFPFTCTLLRQASSLKRQAEERKNGIFSGKAIQSKYVRTNVRNVTTKGIDSDKRFCCIVAQLYKSVYRCPSNCKQYEMKQSKHRESQANKKESVSNGSV